MWIYQIFFNFANLIENSETSEFSLIPYLFSDHWKTNFLF